MTARPHTPDVVGAGPIGGASLVPATGPRAAALGACLAGAVAALLALAAPAPAAAQSIPVGLGAALSAPAGSTIDVPVIVDMSQRSEKLGSFALRLAWDPAVLGFVSGASGSFGSLTVNEDSAAQGVLHLAGANPAGVGGVVIIGVGHFSVLSAATSAVTLTLTELFAAGAPFADLLPSAVVTSGSFCAAVGRYGDFDGNGLANSFDALVALSNAVGLDVSAYNIALGDVDASGATNARDALIILSSAVGLDVSGYRVLQIAGGACATGPLGAIVLAPAAVGNLLVGQEVGFEAHGLGASGPEALTDVAWSSSNGAVLQVTGDGRATALAGGTADVIAVRDGQDTSRVTVAVVARRTMHVVDAAAATADNAVGTPELPFGTIMDAAGVALDGDTIRVRPGRYAEIVTLNVDALLLGDTLADGTRPVIGPLAGQGPGNGGVFLSGSGRRRITAMGFQDVFTAMDVAGPSRLELVGVRATNVGYGLTVGPNLSTLIIQRSLFTGTGVNGFGGSGVSACATRLDSVLVEDTEIGDFGGEGVYVCEFGALTVRRALLRDLFTGVNAGYGESQSGLAVLQQNRITRVQGAYLQVGTADSVRLEDNLLTGSSCSDCVFVNDARFLSMRGDSLEGTTYDWLYTTSVDSVFIDSLHASIGNAGGYVYGAQLVRLTNSRFTNVDNVALDVEGAYFGTGSRLVVDSVSMSASPSCLVCGTGIRTTDTRATVSRLATNALAFAIDAQGDSATTVTQSLFRDAEVAVSWSGPNNLPTGLTVTNTTFEGFADEGIFAGGGLVVIDSNTFVGGQYSVGVDLESAQATSVTRNRLSQVYYGIEVTARDSARTHTVANNVVDAMYEAVMITGQFSSPSALDLRFVVQGNTLNCRQSGYGVNLNDAHATIADNLVQGCDRGVYVSNTNADPLSTRTDSVLRNVLQLPPTVTSGIAVIENTRSVVSGNTIAGDTSGSPYSYGAIWVGAYTTCTYYFTTCEIDSRVDSNVVTGVPGMALYLSGADTVSLTANTINDVSSRGSGPVGLQGAAVALTGAFKGSVSLVGNAVRRAARDGLYFANTDTATLRVDSSLFNGNHVGVEIRQGGAILTRNRIANSDTGIIYGGSGFGSFSTNNIVGNRRMGAVSEESAIFAANNWWGDPLGPRCAQSCDPGSVAGDSISQSGIIFNPPLPSEYGFTPPFSAPPPLRVLAAVRAMPSPAAPPALLAAVAGRPTRGPAVPRAPRTLPHVVAAPRASVPPGLDPVVAQRLGERLAQRAAGLAPRAAAREVWQTRLRASVQALDAAARAAASRRAARDSVEQRRRAAAAPSPGRQQ